VNPDSGRYRGAHTAVAVLARQRRHRFVWSCLQGSVLAEPEGWYTALTAVADIIEFHPGTFTPTTEWQARLEAWSGEVVVDVIIMGTAMLVAYEDAADRLLNHLVRPESPNIARVLTVWADPAHRAPRNSQPLADAMADLTLGDAVMCAWFSARLLPTVDIGPDRLRQLAGWALDLEAARLTP
jgi:hypothetical protein